MPHGAGLGGGSGNAATALWAANELCGRPAAAEELLEWSGDIGSDISVFFSKGAAYCTGRGEIVEDVAPPLPLSTPLLLFKPPVGLATPEIFKALDLSRRSTADPLHLLASLAAEGATPELTVNDLEQPAFDRWGGRLAAGGSWAGGRGGACSSLEAGSRQHCSLRVGLAGMDCWRILWHCPLDPRPCPYLLLLSPCPLQAARAAGPEAAAAGGGARHEQCLHDWQRQHHCLRRLRCAAPHAAWLWACAVGFAESEMMADGPAPCCAVLLLVRWPSGGDPLLTGWAACAMPRPCHHAAADEVPAFLQEAQYSNMFVSPTRLITRQQGEWFAAPTRPGAVVPAASTAATAAA